MLRQLLSQQKEILRRLADPSAQPSSADVESATFSINDQCAFCTSHDGFKSAFSVPATFPVASATDANVRLDHAALSLPSTSHSWQP